MRRKKKLPQMHLTCEVCGETKPATREHFYYEEIKWLKESCKQCVEKKIAAQEIEIQKQVAAGTRQKILRLFKSPKNNDPLEYLSETQGEIVDYDVPCGGAV